MGGSRVRRFVSFRALLGATKPFRDSAHTRLFKAGVIMQPAEQRANLAVSIAR